ncbi:MAG: GAF domain-containing protein [Elusimicrobiota bacterium]|jgi:GAF domain-containing protein|nr:GAF domain-containing protein [Elusimicrobiota bacterium]
MKQIWDLTLARAAAALTDGESDAVANMANIAALIWQRTADINWAGFYILKEGQLVLGPFQGKPACTRIAMGRGVCGTAAQSRHTVVVPDVCAFPGHIACDAASRSEIVVPIVKSDGDLYGVLDIDSPLKDRFSPRDKAEFEEIVKIFARACKF